MKNILPFLGMILFIVPTSFSQSDRFSQDFQPIRSELTSWDPVRGEWLASSLVAISRKQPIPDRTFPENFTPAEMLGKVPEHHRTNINRVITSNQRVATDTSNITEWNSLASIVQRPSCKPSTGRTFGDPHLESFDGSTYSFQTVGEFVLVKSESQNIEIQARQQPQGDDFSLNTAVAMNVGGDRVCIYANEKPDNASNTALRVNGAPVNIARETYFLANGGTIRYSANSYVVTWPTGEKANIEMKNSSQMNFLNITVQIFPCSQQDLGGLLGNGNGRQSDDFDTKSVSNRPAYMAFSTFGNGEMDQASNTAEKEYLAFLSRDFARSFRVTQATSLFDYGFGQSTLAYTDESFPRVHRTVGDLTNDRQTAARNACERQGVSGAEMRGCIFDNAYLEIPPSPRPVIKDPTDGVILGKVEKPIRNVNPKPGETLDAVTDKEDGKGSRETPQAISKPTEKEEVKKESTPIKVTNPISTKESKPSNSGGTTPKPSGGTTPKPSGGTTPKPSGGTTPAPVKPVPAKGKG